MNELTQAVIEGTGSGTSPQLTSNRITQPEVQAAARAYFESDDAFHGDKLPNHTILSEKPIHRLMIYLHAMCAQAGDIAAKTGYSKQFVYQILRQPWARTQLSAILKEAGTDEVQHFLKTEVAPSLTVIRDIRDDTKARQSDRLAASNSILDRAIGKPTVHIESNNKNTSVPADIARIEADIAAARKQLDELGHGSPVGIRN